MAVAVMLPKLGMNMEAATLVRWLKREGESVARGVASPGVYHDERCAFPACAAEVSG